LSSEYQFNEDPVQAYIVVSASQFLAISKAELNTGEFHLLHSHAKHSPTPTPSQRTLDMSCVPALDFKEKNVNSITLFALNLRNFKLLLRNQEGVWRNICYIVLILNLGVM
jgi:hypothetical protein